MYSLDVAVVLQGRPTGNGECLRAAVLASQHQGAGVWPGLLCCLKVLHHVGSDLQIIIIFHKYLNDKDSDQLTANVF